MTRNNVHRALARIRSAIATMAIRAAIPVAFPAALALAVLLAGPAGAADRKHPAKPDTHQPAPDRETVDHAREATACLTLAERAPQAAFESALTWEDRGGGDMARLCQAMSLFHQGQFQAAATRLEDLVPTLGSNTAEGASSLLGRAGWAWLRAGNYDRAERAYGAALQRTPRDPEMLIDRAFARAEAGRYPEAVQDLDKAIELAPRRAEPYLYRAGAYRALGNQSKALEDVGQALALEPSNPEALLLRGNLRAANGNPDGARADWQLVTKVDPDTASARSAADNLKRLQAGQAAEPGK
jgi:tetratricopeptide (TPR) repeat protein